MKRKRLTYDSWDCILSKKMSVEQVNLDFFQGKLTLLEVEDITEPQTWIIKGEEIIVCDKGIKWLSILPENDFYCITAMIDANEKIILWYIDMIVGQGMDSDGIPYFDDLYLDLIVSSDGIIRVDDMDELENALAQGDITQQQFELALLTSETLQNGLLSDIHSLIEYTMKCYRYIKK